MTAVYRDVLFASWLTPMLNALTIVLGRLVKKTALEFKAKGAGLQLVS